MHISRRDFVKYCTQAAAVLGVTAADLASMEAASANPNAPTVLWLEGAGCSGCSVSLLNRISGSAPTTVADLLITNVNLAYHPTLMAAAGDMAVGAVQKAYAAGGYVLVVEGAVPTAFGGRTCTAWTYQDGVNGPTEETFMDAVLRLSSRAAAVVCVGNCASFGGMSAAPPNPCGAVSVQKLIGKSTVNIAGCPPHPDWIIWTFVQLLLGKSMPLDSNGRPKGIYGREVHELCPRREGREANRLGLDGQCLKEVGCRGEETMAPCPVTLWNNGVAWCVGANAPCIGCTEPSFPGGSFYQGD